MDSKLRLEVINGSGQVIKENSPSGTIKDNWYFAGWEGIDMSDNKMISGNYYLKLLSDE